MSELSNLVGKLGDRAFDRLRNTRVGKAFLWAALYVAIHFEPKQTPSYVLPKEEIRGEKPNYDKFGPSGFSPTPKPPIFDLGLDSYFTDLGIDPFLLDTHTPVDFLPPMGELPNVINLNGQQYSVDRKEDGSVAGFTLLRSNELPYGPELLVNGTTELPDLNAPESNGE